MPDEDVGTGVHGGPESTGAGQSIDRSRESSEMLMQVFERYKEASLTTLLNHLIAAQDGVRPEDVTPTYIHQERERRFYRSTRYDVDSRYGGYDSRRLRSITRDEFDAIARRVSSQLSKIFGDK